MKTKNLLSALFIIFALTFASTAQAWDKPKNRITPSDRIQEATAKANRDAVKRGRKNIGLENAKLKFFDASAYTSPEERQRESNARIKKMQKDAKKARRG